jgi:exodeoxyribonuclease-3
MRIATWNVNSLKARLDKVTWWLERARPDVLLTQETKLADAPTAAFQGAGCITAKAAGTVWPSRAGSAWRRSSRTSASRCGRR